MHAFKNILYFQVLENVLYSQEQKVLSALSKYVNSSSFLNQKNLIEVFALFDRRITAI